MAGRRKPSLTSALAKALGAVETRSEDVAAVALARRLAHDIDDAELVHADVRAALEELVLLAPDQHERLFKLAVRIESTAVLTALAPKLTAVLVELGMTPRARAAVVGKGGAQRDDDRGGEHGDDCRCLPCLRQRRARARSGDHRA